MTVIHTVPNSHGSERHWLLGGPLSLREDGPAICYRNVRWLACTSASPHVPYAMSHCSKDGSQAQQEGEHPQA